MGIQEVGELDMKKLNEWIGKLLKDKGPDMPMKGVLAISGMKKKFVFQGVHMVFDGNQWTSGRPARSRKTR